MTMPKIEMVEEIHEILKEAKSDILVLGYKESTIEKYFERVAVDNLKSDELQDVLDWAKTFRDFWRIVFDIRRLLPEENWKRYEEFGIDDMREQVLLRDAQGPFRQCWKARPKIRLQAGR